MLYDYMYVPIMILASSISFASINPLVGTDRFQDDGWSCGVHSSHRVLHNSEMSESYQELRKFIGQHEFKYNTTKMITETVEVEVCNRLPYPLKKACKWTTKTVERSTTVKVPIKLGIGRGLYQLKDKLRSWGVNAVAEERMTLEEIRNLLDQGKHIITLGQIGVQGWGLLSIPRLHWTVTVGHDNEGFYYYDTDSNDLWFKDTGTFYNQWDWNFAGWNKRNSPIHAHLTRNEGLEIRSVIYFDDRSIDKVAILHNLESRVSEGTAERFKNVRLSVDSLQSQRVREERTEIESLNRELSSDLEEVYDELNKLFTNSGQDL